MAEPAEAEGQAHMIARRRPEWTAIEIASHALEATSLSQLTLPEVKKLAARVLRDRSEGREPDATASEAERAAAEPKARRDASDSR